jgi:hypothetical protein
MRPCQSKFVSAPKMNLFEMTVAPGTGSELKRKNALSAFVSVLRTNPTFER